MCNFAYSKIQVSAKMCASTGSAYEALNSEDAAKVRAVTSAHIHIIEYRFRWLPHLFIFLSGSIIALLTLQIFHTYRWSYLPSPHLQHLPAPHWFQISDESGLHSTSSYGEQLAVQNRDATKERGESSLKEALSSLRLAQQMRAAGKDEKAQRLFEHAFALAPKHPEVLLRYGEYLEHNNKDVLLADQYYVQALIINPSNKEALANRQRTAAIVQSLDNSRLQSLDMKRNALSSVSETSSALRRAKKEAYFQHIYHSVGLEGSTMTLAQTRSILETRTAIHGKSIDEHNEILGLDLAMKFINASLVNKIELRLQDILEIHRRVLGHVDPIEGGEFRRTQVYVGGHIPPGPGDLAMLMKGLIQWLNAEERGNIHPVSYAAMAHYKLVHIHPFIDGNGRTSRLLMNTLLMRAGYPPVIIPKQERHRYYQSLKLANDGDIRPFVRFIADCTERTLDLYLWATGELHLPHQVPMLVQAEESELSGVGRLQETTSKAPVPFDFGVEYFSAGLNSGNAVP